MCHHKEKERAVSSVGFWEALGQKGVDGILKVVIVSLYILILEFQDFVMTLI